MSQNSEMPSRAAELLARLSEHLDLEAETHTIAGQEFLLYKVANVDQLLDELILQDDDHIDIVDERLPYWADLWPAAIGLTQYILESPLFEGKPEVLEIGCGLGLCGIAAAKRGGQVIQTDYLPQALELAELNGWLNMGRKPDCRIMDWRKPDPDLRADILIASDVAYEVRAFEPLAAVFKQSLRPGGRVLLSEPGRAIAKPFIQGLPAAGFKLKKTVSRVELLNREVGINIYEISLPAARKSE